jgi:hypothetical protein
VKEIPNGSVLFTPVQHRRFVVRCVGPIGEKVVFFVGAKTKIEVPKACWDGIPDFLRKKGDWVKIGSRHDSGSLERYLDGCPNKTIASAGSYVASVLEHLKIVVVDSRRPSKVRLI